MQLISYFLQVTIYTGLFAAVYYVWLTRTTHHGFNRLFLWTALLLSAILPLIVLPPAAALLPAALTMHLPGAVIRPGQQAAAVSLPGIDRGIWGIYMILLTFFLARLLVRQVQFRRFLRSHPVAPLAFKTYLYTGAGPGSYWRSIFLRDGLEGTAAILEHEQSHIRHHHYIDLFVLQLLKCICWPNPLLHIIGSQLKLVHEYQADKAAGADVPSYARQLLSELFQVRDIAVAHRFFHHPIKKRIMMLQKSTERKSGFAGQAIAAGFLLLLSAAGICLQSGCQKQNAPKEAVYDLVDRQPEFNGDLNAYLARSIKYPEEARSAGKEGRVGIKFVVDKGGNITDVTVARASGVASLDREALRVIMAMPRWKPGVRNGRQVSTALTVPIYFRLD